MQRSSQLYLQDMLDAVQRARTYIAGISRESLLSDAKTIDAIIRTLEVIGEATKSISSDIRSAYPEVEWRRMVGL